MTDKPYYSLSQYYKERFGEKIYKISLNAGLTCPNRDGTLGTDGCIFCSRGGSGDFASDVRLSILEQIEDGKKRLSNKNSGSKFIAYFQSFTNTYGDPDYLRNVYEAAASHPDIVGISIATRPDCLGDEVLALLDALNHRLPVFVELGLQTIHQHSADFIRRGYPLPVFDEAVEKLSQLKIPVVVHLILGLPGESTQDMLRSIDYVCTLNIQGIKLQLLHVLKGTDLGNLYLKTPFPVFSLDDYAAFIGQAIGHIPPHIVIHRITGDAPKSLLIAPLWSGDKKRVLNAIHQNLHVQNITQGCLISQQNASIFSR